MQQLANLANAGYLFWVSGAIPEDRNPEETDTKIIAAYGTERTKHQNYHFRKKRGIASVKYLRWERRYFILATHGLHAFHEEEAGIRDLRQAPIVVGGYAVAFYGGKLSVRIDRDSYKRLKGFYAAVAVGRSVTWLEEKLYDMPFEAWAGVQNQAYQLLAFVNQRRKRSRLLLLAHERAIRRRRRVYRVFLDAEPVV